MAAEHKVPLDPGTRRYLDTLKQLLTASVYEQSNWRVLDTTPARGLRDHFRNAIVRALRRHSLLLVRRHPFDRAAREGGEDWQMLGFTMVGLRRLDNLQTCIESVVADQVPGDLIECGVWRGGTAIFARAALDACGAADRRVWLADSFAGMPALELAADRIDPDFSDEPSLAVSLEEVRENFRKFGLLDERVRFLEGWFAETLPAAPVGPLAILRLDGDHYSSTMAPLVHLYDKVSPGGYIIVDDYNAFAGCRNAVDEFRAARGITAELQRIDRISVYWRREREDA